MKTYAVWIVILGVMAQNAYAATIRYFEIDPASSYVTYPGRVESVEAPDGAPETNDFGFPANYYQYTPPGQLPLSGMLKVTLGEAYSNSIEIEPLWFLPNPLSEDSDFDLSLGPLTLREGTFPNSEPFPSLPPGVICACDISYTPEFWTAPTIDGTLSDGELVFDYRENGLNGLFESPPFAPVWVGEAPPADYSTWGVSDRVAFHVEATVVPIPAAAWLFGTTIIAAGFVGRRKKRST